MDRWQPTQIANLQEIGSFLQGHREQQNLTLQMVSETTHIRSGLLQSLELGQVANLPEPVYLRALLKRYGEFLGFQGQAILDRLDDKRPPLAESPPFQTLAPKPAASPAAASATLPPIVGFPRLSTITATAGPDDSASVVLPNAKPVALGGSGGAGPELGQTAPLPPPIQGRSAPTPATLNPLPPRPAAIQTPKSTDSPPPQPEPLHPAPLPIETAPWGAARTAAPPAPSSLETAAAVDSLSPAPLSTATATDPVRSAALDLDRSLPPLAKPAPLNSPSTSSPWSVMQPLMIGAGLLLGVTVLGWGIPQLISSSDSSGRNPAETLEPSPSEPENPSTVDPNQTPAASAPTAEPAATPPATTTASPTALPLTLAVSVRGGTSWVRATVDGTVAYEGLMEAGSQQSWTAQKTLDLSVGRSDLVWVAVNGLPAQVFGDEPNPKQQTFPQAPAPQSSTPQSSTPQPSAPQSSPPQSSVPPSPESP